MIVKLPTIYDGDILIRPLNLKDSIHIHANYHHIETVNFYNFGPFETFLESRNWLNDELRVSTLYGVFVDNQYLCHFSLVNLKEDNQSATINFIFNYKNELADEANLIKALNEVLHIYISYLKIKIIELKVPEVNTVMNNILSKLDIPIKSVKKGGFYNRFNGEYSNHNYYEIERSQLKK